MSNLFIGREVEKTPAYGANTLYVVGLHNGEDLYEMVIKSHSYVDKTKHIDHIHFGADNSFPLLDINDANGWKSWENMIKFNLDRGILCSLSIDSQCASGLIEGGLSDYNNFIPVILLRLPYVQLLGYNAVIKIDDAIDNKTNPGVWCHSLHELRDRKQFTDWSKYLRSEYKTK